MHKLQLNIKNTIALEILEDNLGLDPNQYTSLPWTAIIETTNSDTSKVEYYLTQKNVGGKNYQAMDLKQLEKSKLNRDNLIVIPGSQIQTVQTLMHPKYGGNPKKVRSEIVQASLQYLYFRYLLSIGDVTLRNILVITDIIDVEGSINPDARLVAGIDMEEHPRKSPEGDLLNLLLPKSSIKSILDILTLYLKDIKYFKTELSDEIRTLLLTKTSLTNKDVDAINNRIMIYTEITDSST